MGRARDLSTAPRGAPTYISVWKDGRLRIGSFYQMTAELFAISSHVLMLVNPSPFGILTYNSVTQTPSRNVRENHAAQRLKEVLGPHMAFERQTYLVIDNIGFELLKQMVTD